MNKVSENVGMAKALASQGFQLVQRTVVENGVAQTSSWWVATVKGELIEMPDDLDLWQKGEPPKEPS